jgi:hypothetical protein
MRSAVRIAAVGLAASGLVACRGPAAPASSTPSPEQVIATAEAIADLTRAAVTPTATLPPFTSTPEPPTATPTLAATATPDFPIATALFNAYVRSGPDDAHPNVDFILQGQTGEILGQYNNFTSETSAGVWYLIRRIGGGLDGWVYGGAVSVAGDPNAIPPIDLVPTPDD